jgi:DEAD/DEAH box helicase domain-containing protein
MERFLARDPLRTLAKLPEAARANPGNPLVLGRQLLCAAYERPLSAHEMDRFGPTGLEAAEQLDRGGELVWQAGRFYYPAYEPPAKNIDLRGTGGPRIRLMVGGEELGEMELSRALTSAHAGAIYLHRGESYVVEELDLMANLARLRPEPVDYFTQAVMQAVIQDNVSLGERPCREGRVRWVGVTVTEQVIGYRRRGLKDDTASEIIPLELPPQSFDTSAVRLEHPGHPGQDWEERSSAVHGVEHAVMAMAPIWAACDRGDLGSAWFPLEPETLGAAVYVYDRAPGGVGLTDALFAQADEWLNDARDLLANCPCAEGCPECLLSLRCEVRNELLSKAGALALLTDLQMVT